LAASLQLSTCGGVGYHLLAADGDIGHVDDFLIDEGCNKEIRVKLRRDESEEIAGLQNCRIAERKAKRTR
jgi:hypothetical protein